MKSRARTVCPIEEAVQADTLCHLSDIATRLDRQLTFDPRAEKFVRDEEANRKLQLRPLRSPYRRVAVTGPCRLVDFGDHSPSTGTRNRGFHFLTG
ncbi:MAG: hypothetical protein V9H26_21355 [Verrucomicrobiota bacterium]